MTTTMTTTTPRKRAAKRAAAAVPVLKTPIPSLEVNALVHSIEELDLMASPVKKAKTERTSVALPPELTEAIEAFANARRLAKYASEQKSKFEAVIREHLGDADLGTIDDKTVIMRMPSHTTHNDSEILQTAYPEAYEASLKRTDYDWLKVVG